MSDYDNSEQAQQGEIIELLAGTHPNGQPVLERVRVLPLPERNRYRLLQSPLFVNGAACGDAIELLANSPGRFRVHERSGQLAIRLLCRDGVTAIAEELTPAVEKLGGELDVQSERALVYSIHVAVGFTEIERLFDAHAQAAGAAWSYGNVYDIETGAPLNWWEPLLAP